MEGVDAMNSKNRELAVELRHDLHRHPEVSNHETWTKAHLIRFLEEHTRLEIVDRGLWFYAIYHAGDGKKSIAYRADFDALPMDEGIELPYASENPGVAHKCGHDGHVASLAGFALEIDQLGADKNIYFLFQHAEETGDGAAECKVFIKENNIEEIFAYHNLTGAPQGSISVIDGTAHWASTGMTVTMTGSPAHASEPEKGVNPAYAIAKIISTIPELIAPEHNDGPVLCTIIQVDIGERAFGISASKGKLLMTIRAHYQKDMDKLQNNIEALAKQLAKNEGMSVEFAYNDTFPDTVNDPTSSDKVRKAARDLGYTLLERENPRRGSEDFGWFLKETKGAIFYVGNGEDYAQIHTYQYDFCDDNIEVAVEMFKALAAM
jgi:amidohydrolase